MSNQKLKLHRYDIKIIYGRLVQERVIPTSESVLCRFITNANHDWGFTKVLMKTQLRVMKMQV